MKNPLLLLPLFTSLFLLGCGTTNPNADCTTGDVCPLPKNIAQQTSLTGVAEQAIQAIKTKDFLTLSTLASTSGVRFSAYEHVNSATDVILTTGHIANAMLLSNAFNRGNYDGSGEPINLGIVQYREKFVYDVDFATAPSQLRNQVTQRGNVINNIATIYANKQIVEYHFTGFDTQYEGMDWKSLYLIFDQENGTRKLIGIVHGQRTI